MPAPAAGGCDPARRLPAAWSAALCGGSLAVMNSLLNMHLAAAYQADARRRSGRR
jgi:hypothetical protein